MVNQLENSLKKIAESIQPFEDLLSKKKTWQCNTYQKKVFKKVKYELSKPTSLTLYDPNADKDIS